VSFNPLYNWVPLPDSDPSLNDAMRQIDDSLRFLLETSGSTPGPVATELNDLNDTEVPSPNDNDLLSWDQATAKWINIPAPNVIVDELNDLNDVTITSPEKEQILKYTGAQWVNLGPVDLTFGYTTGKLTAIDGSDINIDLAYNPDGTLDTIDNQTKILTAGYTSGQLSSLTVTNS